MELNLPLAVPRPVCCNASMECQPVEEQSEFRQDTISGRWVIFAPERGRRPLGLSKPKGRENAVRDVCPFCPGPGQDTPPPSYAFPAEGPWQVFACPNKYPAVRPIEPETHGLTLRRMLDQLPGFGVHELVVEGRDHFVDPIDLSDGVYGQVLICYRERIRHFAADARLDYVAVFKNVGSEAGASMAHTHSQLIGTPFIPNTIRDEIAGAETLFRKKHRCAFCESIKPRQFGITNFVAESDHFIAVCPFAPRFAYEMWVLPKSHSSHYETMSDPQAVELAVLLKRIFRALDAVAGVPAYNYYLHTAPLRSEPSPSYHWHIEIAPKTARPAGFEWSSGVFINTVLPERAAKDLRGAVV